MKTGFINSGTQKLLVQVLWNIHIKINLTSGEMFLKFWHFCEKISKKTFPIQPQAANKAFSRRHGYHMYNLNMLIVKKTYIC